MLKGDVRLTEHQWHRLMVADLIEHCPDCTAQEPRMTVVWHPHMSLPGKPKIIERILLDLIEETLQ